MFVLNAAMMLDTAKRKTEPKRAGLRPQISLVLVQMGPAAALASKYAPPIHVYPDADFKSDAMVGIAVLFAD